MKTNFTVIAYILLFSAVFELSGAFTAPPCPTERRVTNGIATCNRNSAVTGLGLFRSQQDHRTSQGQLQHRRAPYKPRFARRLSQKLRVIRSVLSSRFFAGKKRCLGILAAGIIAAGVYPSHASAKTAILPESIAKVILASARTSMDSEIKRSMTKNKYLQYNQRAPNNYFEDHSAKNYIFDTTLSDPVESSDAVEADDTTPESQTALAEDEDAAVPASVEDTIQADDNLMIINDKKIKKAAKRIAPFLFLFVWQMYSSLTRKVLKKGKFSVIEIVSEMRPNYGNTSKVPEIASQFRKASIEEIGEDFVPIYGESFGSESDSGNICIQGDVAFQYTDDGKKIEMYGRQKPTNLSLRELVAEKTKMVEIEEDVLKRINWSNKMEECLPVKDNLDLASTIEGSYHWCYRDYVNFEELMGMMWKRFGIERFLYKCTRTGILSIDQDSKKCIQSEQNKLFGTIPLGIEWEGKLEEGTIHWTSTSMRLGWKWFGKTFPNPAPAEKLRKDPWHISIPKEKSVGDILCFDRESVGKLVFAKDQCLSGGETISTEESADVATDIESANSALPHVMDEKYVQARQQPKSPEEAKILAGKYAAITSLEERAYQILVDLGMVEVREPPVDNQ